MKALLSVLIILFLGSSYLLVGNLDGTGNVISVDREELVFVSKVIDGDTIVANGEHIRLLGMDADERGYDCYKEAKLKLEEWILDKEVVLEKDVTNKDQYKRLLRYVILDGENINIKLVEEGLAVARFYRDRKYEVEILGAEKAARGAGIGCKWGKIDGN
jgi:endonuclease YncB( thermonuclease family)